MKTYFKTVLCVFLVLCLLAPAFASTEPGNPAYVAGKTYSLIEEKLDLSGLDVYAPGYALENFGLAASESTDLVKIGTYEDFASDHTLTLRYASKDLSTLMFGLDGMEGIVCLRNNRLIVCFPNFDRGAEDTYEAFARFTRQRFTLASRNGMTFSNDGRYALFIDGYQALIMANFCYQLFILDVEEGQYYLAYTWSTKYTQGAEAVISACFDETDEHIYIKAYGNAYGDYRNDFLRYSMETGKMEHLKNHSFDVDYSNLYALSDGSYVHSFRPMSISQPCGILSYREVDGKWVATAEHFHQPTQTLRPFKMEVNKNGQALFIMELGLKTNFITGLEENSQPYMTYYALSLPTLLNKENNLQKLIWFNDNYMSAERVSVSEFVSLASRRFSETVMQDIVYNAALSPDGKYAIVLIGNRNRYNLSVRIINTETLGISPVLIEEDFLSVKVGYGNSMSAEYPVGIQFIANDLVIINTDSGLKLFRIQ